MIIALSGDQQGARRVPRVAEWKGRTRGRRGKHRHTHNSDAYLYDRDELDINGVFSSQQDDHGASLQHNEPIV